MNTNRKTDQETKKLSERILPQVIQLEKKYKLTRPQRVTAYNALIEILKHKRTRPASDKLRKMRGAAGDRVRAFLENVAGLIVDAVNTRKAA